MIAAALLVATLLVILAWLFSPASKRLSILVGFSVPLMMLMFAARSMAAHYGMSVNAFDDHDRPLASVLLSDRFAVAVVAVSVLLTAAGFVWSCRHTSENDAQPWKTSR